MSLKDIDKGPWRLAYSPGGSVTGVQSEDFNLDVLLEVSGDFITSTHKMLYCEQLMAALNDNR